MENQSNTADQNLPQVGQNPAVQPVVATPKTNYPMIGGVALVCSLIFGVGGYYLGKQSSNPQYVNNEVQINPTATPYLTNPTNTPTTQISTLPTGWSYKDNKECGVKFAIPPKEAPYYYPVDVNRQPSVTNEQGSGRFWDFPRGGVYPNLLTKFPNGYDQHKQAVTMFASPDEASGYVSQAVVVSCIPNNGRFANNTALISSLTTELEKYNSQTGEKGMQASTYKINSNTPATKWGKNVVNLVVSEDTTNVAYTMFVTPQYVYEIKVIGATSDTFVKDTAKKIFDNLSFQ
ncbi:hypothetical protein A2130_04205 [Candidatus Woesebacteria bacterium GWC2_33_12]|uniref:Uncharacterized protein n=1 Tax=Candidatus Woesebacteria bacterium GW2011_GWB1_33_22 TaxID=1618566 RepID=A0A0G0CK65_9BACT|nr:MAG: hypothetical protein UR29_C0018G0002 [Candidatus Woesebacteria bacterium GW2011_GWC2_33_12]KKP41442.1 MAG: hypothetical protein UR33_C0016G0003 [Candidatus Woesebacteria bacterium GW2011_GWA2_33_20]KKP43832.1 MAG: hypothetical protein UR35_C0016G0010 [Candidatus Woesebacteria bacterium GW2011_GWB1_33_22]KKP45402.1 MAG: hypothetical protein UR37_C0018G0010 [Microgenomates group bacterium GW2011_GWC1_33_28]KKP49284.1 MAG: hypothetical protein UR41_C0017G0010 [Candidatus Woesebacteria bact